jgi:hypothetical protein
LRVDINTFWQRPLEVCLINVSAHNGDLVTPMQLMRQQIGGLATIGDGGSEMRAPVVASVSVQEQVRDVGVCDSN